MEWCEVISLNQELCHLSGFKIIWHFSYRTHMTHYISKTKKLR